MLRADDIPRPTARAHRAVGCNAAFPLGRVAPGVQDRLAIGAADGFVRDQDAVIQPVGSIGRDRF